MDRKSLLTKSKNDLINLINNNNYTASFKLQRLDELMNAYKFQLKKAIEENIEE